MAIVLGLQTIQRQGLSERRSAALLGFDLGDSSLHQFLDERRGERLVRGEFDGAFGGGVAFQFLAECTDHRGCGKQAAMVRKSSEPHEYSLVFERGNTVADGLSSVAWRGGTNGRAELF